MIDLHVKAKGGISLVNIAYELLAGIILHRFPSAVEKNVCLRIKPVSISVGAVLTKPSTDDRS